MSSPKMIHFHLTKKVILLWCHKKVDFPIALRERSSFHLWKQWGNAKLSAQILRKRTSLTWCLVFNVTWKLGESISPPISWLCLHSWLKKERKHFFPSEKMCLTKISQCCLVREKYHPNNTTKCLSYIWERSVDQNQPMLTG